MIANKAWESVRHLVFSVSFFKAEMWRVLLSTYSFWTESQKCSAEMSLKTLELIKNKILKDFNFLASTE